MKYSKGFTICSKYSSNTLGLVHAPLPLRMAPYSAYLLKAIPSQPKSPSQPATMAPRVKGLAGAGEAEVPASAPDGPATAAVPKRAMKAAPKRRAKGAAKDKKETAKEKKAASQFHDTIAEKTGVTKEDVEKVIKAVLDQGVAALKEKGSFRFQGMVLFRLKKTAARPAKTKSMFGKEVLLKAKPAGQKLFSTPLKQFKQAAVS